MIAPALRALLEHSIDYAGTFPPASLSTDDAALHYEGYLKSAESWMLGRFVVSAADAQSLPEPWRLSILSDADDPRANAIESKRIFRASVPTYCEVSIGQLDEVKAAGAYAKVRTGGVTATAIPSTPELAGFIRACARRKLPFKATAGLHHPIRSVQALTYAPDAPTGVMHGFINVLMAAAMVWNGEEDVERVLEEQDRSAFAFGEQAQWRARSLSTEQIATAREQFIHSFGSCSFMEPILELRALGWL
ncbi:MAG: hypothetical protein JO061_23150 [Acidobacteriaceae bacterium]|nr:hypothetical protein [Acidobacteriaceae bacterium]